MLNREILEEKNQRITFPVLFIGVFLCFVFYCNHNALFISDYYLPIVFFILAAIIYFYRCNVPLKANLQIYCIAALSLIFIIGTCTNRQYLNKGVILSYALWFLFYVIAELLPVNRKDIDFIIYSFIAGALICALIVIIIRYEYRWPGTGRYSIHIGNQEPIDPNYLATYMIIGGTLALDKAIKKANTIIYNIVLLLSLALISIAIFMTGSRGGVLAYIISLTGIVIRLFIEYRHKIRTIHVVLFVIFCIVGIVILIKVLPDNIVDRIFHMDLDDGSNALRVAHWEAAFKCYLQRPVFGYGAMLTLDTLQVFANHVGDAHNTYLTILLQFGTSGFIFFAIMFLDVLKKIFNKENVVFVFLLLGQAFSGFIIANHLGISLWMTVLLCYYIGKEYKKEKEKTALCQK